MTAPAAHRLGHPSPLHMHLGAPAISYLQAVLAAPNAAEPAFPWHHALTRYDGPPPPTLDVAAEAARRLSGFLRGVEAWQRHPYRRDMAEPPTLWQDGTTRLIDYGQCAEATNPGGRAVLVVPSLINRAYILDLLPERAFLRHLAASGLRPLLLDWGAPGGTEAGFDLDDYIARRLLPALAIARVLGGAPPALLGYCMGGTLCAGAVLSGAEVAALVTVGAPWNFTAGRGLSEGIRAAARQGGIAQIRAGLHSIADAFGVVPVAVFQHLFALVDPIQACGKFRRFARLDPAGEAARRFVALEDWLADGVPMTGPAARQLLVDWHLENTPHTGRWPRQRPALAVRPPCLLVTGKRDRIAQPAMAAALSRVLPEAEVLRPDTGHVGMIAGSRAVGEVWEPVVAFLRNRL